MPIRAVFFDVMDTLVHDPFRDVMPSFLGLTLDELIRVKHPTAWVDFELGRIDEARFLELFLPAREWDPIGFCRAVRGAYRWLPGIEPMLAELRGQDERPGLYALSNYTPWYAWIDAECGLSRYLDRAFVSYHTGVRKPDPEAYLVPCRALDLDPRDALFVDDRASDCDAARAVGMDAIVFRGEDDLRAELARRGLVRAR